jgi:hypothetical protein
VAGGTPVFKVDYQGNTTTTGTMNVSGVSTLTGGATLGGVVKGAAGVPTIAAGTGAGTSPTIAVTANSTNLSGDITLTTGTTPAASATLFTVTLANSVSAPNRCEVTLTPENAATAGLTVGAIPYAPAGGTTTWTVNSSGTALSAGTAFAWHYTVTTN